MVLAPIINIERKYLSPALVMRPNLTLPSELCCDGVSPTDALDR
jgi:hypothetical protein